MTEIVEPLVISEIPNVLFAEGDEDEFTVSVLDANNTTTVIDIERITKTNSYTKEDEIVRSGFSKLIPGDRVIISGYPQKTAGNRLTGIRILQLPEAPKHPNISFTSTDTISPSPTKKISPTP